MYKQYSNEVRELHIKAQNAKTEDERNDYYWKAIAKMAEEDMEEQRPENASKGN